MQKTAKAIGGNFSEDFWTQKLSLERSRQVGDPTEQELQAARENFISDVEKASNEKNLKKATRLKKRAAQKYQSVKSRYDNAEWIRLRPSKVFKNDDKITSPVVEKTTDISSKIPTQSSNNGKQEVSTAVAASLSAQR